MSKGRGALDAAVAVLLVWVFVERMVSGSPWAFVPLLILMALVAMTTYRLIEWIEQIEKDGRLR